MRCTRRTTVDGEAIDPERTYRYLPERGPQRDRARRRRRQRRDRRRPARCIDIDRDDFADPVTLAQSKRLMRHLLQHHLSGQLLQTRRLVLDLQSLEDGAAR